MNFETILDIVKVLIPVTSLGVFFFFYFKNPSFREKADGALKFLPAVLAFASTLIKDKKGVFDTHDALVVMQNVSIKIQETIQDPTNKTFLDVEEEVMQILEEELAKYANLPGVPNLKDGAVRVQVKVVFESIQRAMREDPTRNGS